MAIGAHEPFMFTFSIISVFVYLVVLRMLIKFRHKDPFCTSFFKICISLAISDIISICHNHLTFKFRLWAVFGIDEFYLHTASGTYWGSIWYSVNYYIGYVQALGVLVISLNRLTALAIPFKHHVIWQRYFKRLIALSWLLPAILVAPWWAAGPEIVTLYRNNITDDVRYLLRQDYKKAYLLISFVVFLVVAVLVTPMYGVAFCCYHKQKSKVQPIRSSDQPTHNSNLEAKLALTGFLIFCVLLSYIIFSTLSIIRAVTHPFDVNIWVPMYLVSVDLLSTCNPWILLACSRKVRAHFTIVLLCRKDDIGG